jgi:dethiobiotin synthetase
MAKGFFIIGSDTGVGKTIISAALIKAIGSIGLKACGMKPIETGCKKTEVKSQKSKVKNNVLIPSDGTFLKNISNVNESIDLITPIRFESPLAPLPASEIDGREIDLNKIRDAYAELSKKYDVIITEGIGGLLVPIKNNYFVLDLAIEFNLPLIVASRPSIGTLNHTLLTVNYAIKEGLDVAGIIINYSQPPEGTLAEKTNPEVIKQISPVPLLGIFPYLKNLKSSTIEKTAVKNLDIKTIKKFL